MTDEPILLVCRRAASAPLVSAGASFDRKCSKCLATVVLAPSSQRLLRENKDCVIICLDCQLKSDEEVVGLVAATPSELENEIFNPIPNEWRNRN